MAKPVSPDHGRPSQQRGLSILELLVAAAIGLLIVAAGSIVLASHLREGCLWLIEVRLKQDLRAATDLITRDLRRAGYWGAAEQGLWASGGSGSRSNPYTALAPESGASDAVSFRYSRDATENHRVDGNEQFGYRLRGGVIQVQLGAGNWQALTDANSLEVTSFEILPTVTSVSIPGVCAPTPSGSSPCAAADPACVPYHQVRRIAVSISARGMDDRRVTRQLRSQVRLRNDVLVNPCGV